MYKQVAKSVESPGSPWLPYKLPYWVLAFCLFCTAVIVYGAHHYGRERHTLEFELEVTRLEARVIDRLDSYLGVVWAAVGLVEANDLKVSNAQLRKFRLAAASGGRNDGLANLTFVRKIKAQNLSEFEQNNRHLFPIHPARKDASEPAYIVTHVEPMTPDSKAVLGYNPYSDPVRKTALEKAVETGGAVVTSKLSLKTDSGEVTKPAIILYAPVYHPGDENEPRQARKALLFGFLGAGFHLSDLLAHLRQDERDPSLGMAIYSGAQVAPDNLLIQTPEEPEELGYRTRRTILIGEHPWTIEYWSLPAFHARAVPLEVSLAGILGLLLSLALFLASALFVRAREAREETLHQMRQRALDLEEQAKTKTKFFSNLNHELRTPLNGILGMSDLLYDTDLNAQQHDYLEAIGSCGKSLLDLVNDVLDLSKIEAGKMELRSAPVRLKETFRQATQVVRGPAQGKGLKLIFEWSDGLPEWAELDGPRLRQVLVNLLGNAIKFTATGSVTLKVDQELEAQSKILVFTVSDTGVGISASDRTKLFKPFSQVGDNSQMTTDVKGTGLGLHICKEILELMGGRIEVESTLGEGTTFRCEIPLLAIEGDPYETNRIKAVTSVPAREVRILVVDDNPINRRVLALQLGKLGYEAELACDGNEAVTKALASDYDVILMDCQMPGVDGLEATRQIRKEATTKPTIIALTAMAEESQRQACLGAGMDEFLAKPVEIARLDQLLRTISQGCFSSAEA